MTAISGTMLTPGVSRNMRLYTKELIGKAVARAQSRIDSGGLPITLLTHHQAEDDSTRIVGHLTQVEQTPDGSARFTAALADTPEATTIESLHRGGHLGSVSIRGWWLGETRTEFLAGQAVTTADDLEIDGVDFTKSPGVDGALLDPPGSKASESARGRRRIVESVSRVQFGEARSAAAVLVESVVAKLAAGEALTSREEWAVAQSLIASRIARPVLSEGARMPYQPRPTGKPVVGLTLQERAILDKIEEGVDYHTLTTSEWRLAKKLHAAYVLGLIEV